jgi:hypothetical protein
MILKQYKVIMLHLELLHSNYLTHFHLKWIKSNQNRRIHEWNREYQTTTEQYVNRVEMGKISISPMTVAWHYTAWH